VHQWIGAYYSGTIIINGSFASTLLLKSQVFGVCQVSIFIFPDQTGTATSSPADNTAFQTDMNIVKVMLYMKKNAYEESTIDTRSTERYISLFD
jgi:hypothetical protein